MYVSTHGRFLATQPGFVTQPIDRMIEFLQHLNQSSALQLFFPFLKLRFFARISKALSLSSTISST